MQLRRLPSLVSLFLRCALAGMLALYDLTRDSLGEEAPCAVRSI